MEESTRICARLLREGAVLREELSELDDPDIRRDIEKRLEAVGLILSTSAYSGYVGLRLSSDITSDPAFDAASNLGLHADSCALLVILWARLVLQKRTASDTREIPGQASLMPDERASAARKYKPQVRLTTLVREFRHVLGSPTRVKGLVSQLRKIGFLGGLGETIEPGPLLELGIDGERMVTYIRRQVLADLLQQKSFREKEDQIDDGSEESKVLDALRELPEGVGMAQLEKMTGMRRSRLRAILGDLSQARKVRPVGERAKTRYQVIES